MGAFQFLRTPGIAEHVVQPSSAAGFGGVSPPVCDSRTGTVLKLAAEDGCATALLPSAAQKVGCSDGE